jgi:hypothetical protein
MGQTKLSGRGFANYFKTKVEEDFVDELEINK